MDPDPTNKDAQHGLGLQLALASAIGMSALVTFSLWRLRWPRLYAARTFRRSDLPQLPNTMFGWMATLYKTSDTEVLEYAGLDAFVFLMFFRAAFSMISRMALLAIFAIGPLRWYYTGKYDDDDDPSQRRASLWVRKHDSRDPNLDNPLPGVFGNFHWVYVVFTYLFTVLCLKVLRDYTNRVVKVRQDYLGRQNSITDRTLRLTGIPHKMRNNEALVEYMSMSKGQVRSVALCYDWSALDKLFSKRREILTRLEGYWGEYIGPTLDKDVDLEGIELPRSSSFADVTSGNVGEILEQADSRRGRRPRGRVEMAGLKGPMVDLIDYYTEQLESIDEKIAVERNRTDRNISSTAFVTMDSVSTCQMSAQTMLSPKPHRMLPHLAPAPHDVIWSNTYLRSSDRSMRTWLVSGIFLLTTVTLSLPVSYLAGLLDIKSIHKYAPWLADWLQKSPFLETFVTQVLTTYIFTVFNLLVPYFFAYLSRRQGYVSREDVELSTISKNFLYVFFNLFLVFTIAQNYFSLLRDTTKIALQLAGALRRLSAFYTNLIVLQGIGILPLRLLQAGSVLQLPWFMAHARSARDYHELYKPQKLNYGLSLPTPLLILIIVLMYSVLNNRILVFGCVYFWIAYYVYKYQFMYSMVHPQHSTGRLWTLMLRRFLLGLGLFQLAMMGILAIESAYAHALMLIPLPIFLCIVWYDFENFTEPLLRFIAVEAVKTVGSFSASINDGESYADDAQDEQALVDSEGLLADRAEQGVGAGPVEANDNAPAGDASVANTDTTRRRANTSALSFSIFRSDSDSDSSDDVIPLGTARRRQSRTLDEEREQDHQYVNSNVIATLEGPWVAVEGGDCVTVRKGRWQKRRMSFSGWE